MNIFSDSQIAALTSEGKRIPEGLRPLSRQVERNQHRRRDYEIQGESGNGFMVAVRQSMLNPFDFSVILGYKVPGLHMHLATERYQRFGGLREDGFAQETTRYWNIESAIDRLIEDCGFVPPINESPLFTGNPYAN